MKILFCVLCLSYGGAEKNLCFIANGMVARGHDVVICNMNTLPTMQSVDERIRIYNMPQYEKKVIKRIQQYQFIKKVCKEEQADVIVSFLFIPNFLATLVGRRLRIPVVISERADPNQHRDWAGRLIYYVYRFADGAVFQTEGAKACFPKSLQMKSVVIPNPVMLRDDAIFVDYRKAKKSIAYSARFEVKQKRQDVMLEAFQIVHQKHSEYILDFYGDGPDENRMKEYAERLHLGNCVKFNGISRNILKDISKSAVFVLSSDFEGIPNSLLEAMSIGLPCVSTDCSPGGARMLIEDGKNGLLVSCGDSNALAAGICKMIEDRGFAMRCGLEALHVRERFSKKKIIDAWETFCKNVCVKKGDGVFEEAAPKNDSGL